jgi:hypothetical protein
MLVSFGVVMQIEAEVVVLTVIQLVLWSVERAIPVE